MEKTEMSWFRDTIITYICFKKIIEKTSSGNNTIHKIMIRHKINTVKATCFLKTRIIN